MITIPLQNDLRIRRGIHGIWVLEKLMGEIKGNQIWKFLYNYSKMENLITRLMDEKAVLSEGEKTTLIQIQEAYNQAVNEVAETVRKIDLSNQYEETLQRLEDENKRLKLENNSMKTQLKERKNNKGNLTK